MNQARPLLSVKIAAIVVGAVVSLTALFGLWYNTSTLVLALGGGFGEMIQGVNMTYFHRAFYVMSAFCITCYAVILLCGIDLLRSRLRSSTLLSILLWIEVAYFFTIGFLWTQPKIGMSVAAATGVANGGLVVQFMLLLPLWVPLVLWWARVRQAGAEDPWRDAPSINSNRPPSDNPYASP